MEEEELLANLDSTISHDRAAESQSVLAAVCSLTLITDKASQLVPASSHIAEFDRWIPSTLSHAETYPVQSTSPPHLWCFAGC